MSTTRRSHGGASATTDTSPTARLAAIAAAAPAVPDDTAPPGQPAAATSGESSPTASDRLGSMGGEITTTTADRARYIDEGFATRTCLAHIGTGGLVCGNPSATCTTVSHKNKSKATLQIDCIVAVSGAVGASRTALKSSPFIPRASDLPKKLRDALVKEGEAHQMWSEFATAGRRSSSRRKSAEHTLLKQAPRKKKLTAGGIVGPGVRDYDDDNKGSSDSESDSDSSDDGLGGGFRAPFLDDDSDDSLGDSLPGEPSGGDGGDDDGDDGDDGDDADDDDGGGDDDDDDDDDEGANDAEGPQDGDLSQVWEAVHGLRRAVGPVGKLPGGGSLTDTFLDFDQIGAGLVADMEEFREQLGQALGEVTNLTQANETLRQELKAERRMRKKGEKAMTEALLRLDSRLVTLEVKARQLAQQRRGATNLSGNISLNTSLGTARFDGKRTTITLGLLTRKTDELSTQLNELSNTDPKSSIACGSFYYASSQAAIIGMKSINPSGFGFAAWPGATRSWGFKESSPDSVTVATLLTTTHKAHNVGLKNATEAAVLALCGRVLPFHLGGSVDTLAVDTKLPLFTSKSKWFGQGLGDGSRDRALDLIRACTTEQRRYARASLTEPRLLEAALECIQVVETFVVMVFGYIDNLIYQLVEANMPESQIMILCSRVLYMLWETVHPHHRSISHVDSSDKGLLTAAAAVASFQEVAVMKEYIEAKIVDHPKINNCFIRFLTVQSVKNNQQMSKADIKALVAKEAERMTTQIKAASDAATAAKAVAEKVTNKLDRVIVRNELKTGGK